MLSQDEQHACTSGQDAAKKGPRAPRRKRAAKRGSPPTEGQSTKVTLPGQLHQEAGQWWWRTKLPGEERERVRPLRVPGTDEIACDWDTAEKIALEMWGQAAARHGARDVTLDCEQKVERLKAQFLDKVRQLTEIVESANAQARAEAKTRVELEERLNAAIRAENQQTTTPIPRKNDDRTPQTGICECCGVLDVPVSDLEAIDSGQLLCHDCITALRTDISRTEANAFSIGPV
ncbi:MAG TPA: hypothetical protein VLI39_19110 [Sedimentisphaerales bacterium]|nr:hypothetical protein [Sedimentisphaerales bacterium]